ncbi:unnamed protein product, partial [Hapterophycus canaliculatus]
MSAALDATSRPTPNNLRELLERVPRVLDAQAPRALHLESCASTDVIETMSRAEARLLKSAETFFKPLFRVSVLENLGRDDPFAEPRDEEWPDETPDGDLEAERQRLDGITDRTLLEQPHLKTSVEEAEEQAAHLQERMETLAMHVDAAPGPSCESSGGGGDGRGYVGRSILDTVYTGADEEAHLADLQNEETLRLDAEARSAAEARRAALQEEAAALRADLARQQREVEFLEREQAVALASEASAGEMGGGESAGASPDRAATGRRTEASKETESLVGVAGMPKEQLDACVQEEGALVERNGGIRDWYAGTVANLQLLVGVRVCHRLLFGMGSSGRVEGMEFMVELGPGKIMEVTVSAADGSLSSVQLCHGQQDSGSAAAAAAAAAVSGAAEDFSPLELEKLRCAANALPAPQNLRMVVREALSRVKCAGLVEEHLRLMRRRYLVGYRAPSREVTVTMGVGIIASLRLHVDYPKV